MLSMDSKQGWSISHFRVIMDGRIGCSSTIFRGIFMRGTIHKKHRYDNCNEMYYVVRGHGLAGAGGRPEPARRVPEHRLLEDLAVVLVARQRRRSTAQQRETRCGSRAPHSRRS
ncbi:MAG: hypothetical protein HC807_07430 [Gammaproteobacteria bacterium]|nr:hypothetical protein [Gammaproteobacteria bacterium]